MLVDDSVDMRILLRVYLEQHDILVVGEAHSLERAKEVAATAAPDAIVADVHLADTDDLDQIVSELRDTVPDALIIALSAAPPALAARESVIEATGCYAYLDKGDGIGHLADQVAHLLKGRSPVA